MNQSSAVDTVTPTDTERSGGGWSSDRDSPIKGHIYIQMIIALIASIGIVGNLLVVFTAARVPECRTITNLFITSLASCDLISSVFIIMFEIGIDIDVPPGNGGKVMCALFLSKWPLWSSFVVSSLSLTCVTFERYFSICRPLQYSTFFTFRKVILIIVGVWLTGFTIKSYQTYVVKYDGSGCFVQWSSKVFKFSVGIISVMSIYIVPLTAMAITYVLIIRGLAKSAKNISQSSGSESRATLEILQARKKVVKMLATVVITFALCWAENQIIYTAYSFGIHVDFTSWYYHASVMIAFCNTCFNPLIYAFQMKHYRRYLKMAICGHNSVNPVEDDVVTIMQAKVHHFSTTLQK